MASEQGWPSAEACTDCSQATKFRAASCQSSEISRGRRESGNIIRGQLWVPAPKAEQQVQPRREPQHSGDGAGSSGSAGFGVNMEENGQDGEVLSCRSR